MSTFEHRCEIRLLYLLKILILTIAVCELRRGFALQCFHCSSSSTSCSSSGTIVVVVAVLVVVVVVLVVVVVVLVMADATKLQIYSFSIIVIFNYTMKYNFLQFLPVTVVYIITAI